MAIKDKLYDYFVRKNQSIQHEYERYVREHIDEHNRDRWKHWKLLLKLHWHYGVKKSRVPYLYADRDGKNGSITLVKSSRAKPEEGKKEPGAERIFPESRNAFEAAPEVFAEWLLQYDVISFDIFDTLVFRIFHDPGNVFWLVGNEIYVPDYKSIRMEAEKEARKKEKSKEVTIEEIYEVIAEQCSIDANRGTTLEVEYEKKVCFANPYMLEVYKLLKKNGKKMIAVSNMYLRKEQIKQILDACGYDEMDEIYVSCEYRVSKKNGGLQSRIRKSLRETERVIHVGDNYYMDIEGARIAGWKAVHYKNINKIGNMYRPDKMTEIAGSIYKGLVNAKLYNGIPLNPYYEYGYAYVGYLVCGFCKWLNQIAKCQSIDKFFFVSRDMDVVSRAYTQYFHGIPSEYVKASRTSSIHLSFERQTQHFFDWHIKRRISGAIPMYQVLKELQIECLSKHLSQYGLAEGEILTTENCECLKRLIMEHKQEIADLYTKEKRAAEQYYREKAGSGKRICVVDLGWKGSTANSLEYFLKEYCGMDVEILCALLGMEGHAFVDERMSMGKVFSYMFSNGNNTDCMEEHNINGNIWRRIYEIVFTSNEQSLLRFCEKEDGQPDFEYLRKEIRNESIVENLHHGILDFVRDFRSAEKRIGADLQVEARDACQPWFRILRETDYNLRLFEAFEVCFIAGDVGEERAELFRDVVQKGGR